MLPTSSKAAVQLLPMLRPNDLQRSLRRRQVAAQPVHRLDKRGRQFGIQPALVSVTVGKKQSELDRIVDDGLQRAAKTLQGHVSVHCRWLLDNRHQGPKGGLLPFLDGFLASCFFCSAAFPSPGCRRLAGFAVDIVDGGQAAARKKCWLDGAGAKCTVTNAQMRCEKTRHLRAYPPKNVWKGPQGDYRGISPKGQSFPIFRGARQEARMREG